MTATKAILNYATIQGGFFQRKDLLVHISNRQPNINMRTVDLQLNRLVNSRVIFRRRRGEYVLTENCTPEFMYKPSEKEKNIFMKLRLQFPFLEMCIWSPRVISLFMHHIPNIGYCFLDVEKDGMEPVFNALMNMNLEQKVLFLPSPTECERYLTGTDSIVVRHLISESPLTEVDGCMVPRIEKILVDAIEDNEFNFARGSEIYTIFEYALERNNVNIKKLLRYASRRNRKNKVEQILNTIKND